MFALTDGSLVTMCLYGKLLGATLAGSTPELLPFYAFYFAAANLASLSNNYNNNNGDSPSPFKRCFWKMPVESERERCPWLPDSGSGALRGRWRREMGLSQPEVRY